jgi:hypothetical protein
MQSFEMLYEMHAFKGLGLFVSSGCVADYDRVVSEERIGGDVERSGSAVM